MSRRWVWGCLVLALAAPAGPVAAQSLTGGSVSGVVRDAAGVPVFDVVVTMEPVAGGVARADTTLRDGRFAIEYLPPGEYEVLAERLGYRPQRVRGVTIAPGRTVRVTMEIAEVPGTPESADLVQWDGGVVAAGAAGLSTGAATSKLLGMPVTGRTLDEATRLSSFVGPGLEARGLPGIYSGFLIDGVPVRGGRHPLLGSSTARAAALRLVGFDRVEVLLDDSDVELSGFAGAVIAAHSRTGGRAMQVDGFADVSAGALRTSKHFDPADVGGTSVRGGVVLSGPIVPDTARFAVGLEIDREEVPRPALLDGELSPAAAAVLDRLGTSYTSLGEPFGASLETVAGFGSLDWQITEVHRLTTRLDAARVGAAEPELGGGGLVSTSSGTDLMLSGSLTSRVGRSNSLEFRFGLDRTSREYASADDGVTVPYTAIADGSLGFGMGASLPGTFETTSVFLSEAFHSRSEQHQVKLGAGVWLAAHERSPVPGAAAFYYPGTLGPTGARGYAIEPSGNEAAPSFATRQFFAYLQDRWSISSEAELIFGVRAEYEQLPLEDIPPDSEWGSATGLDNVDVTEQPEIKIAPRVGFNWDLGGEGRYFLRGTAGVYHETADPDVLAEVMDAGRRTLRVRTGAPGGWPDSPTGGDLTELRFLSILAPGFRPPRSERGSLGLGVSLGGGLSFDAMGTYGRTTGLLRRTDLNRLRGTVAIDQDGRPVFGTLVKDGGLLYADPGSNRRFSNYDHVYAIDSDAEADHLSISAGLERSAADGLTFFARYTWSRTTDDWLNAGLAPHDLGLSPFPGADDPWSEGTADFDVPHRVAAGLDVPLTGTPVRIGGFYRFASGRAFTPGFPAGVDANGDGAFGNDPAAAGAAVGSLASAWPCLREETNGFVDRNACRDPDVHRLDLRVSADLRVGTAGTLSVFADGLDLLESDLAIRDHALYRLDPAAGLQPDGAGRITVPLVVNPDFGQPLVRLSSGRALRFGVQLRY